MALQRNHYRFTVRDYEQMVRVDLISESAHAELIDGAVWRLAQISPRHASTVTRMDRALSAVIADTVSVRVRGPILLDDYNEPQPDLTLIDFRQDFYATQNPMPEDIDLVIEVADTSLQWDRKIKAPLYARAGIPEFWLVDLHGEAIVRYSEPLEGKYRVVRRLRRGQHLTAATLPGLRLPVAAILG